jgi:hypothetical protein
MGNPLDRPMFDSTLPNDSAALMRVSEFERRHTAAPRLADADAGATRLVSLNPSLMQDLLRFERDHRSGEGLDVLEVLAAALRHARPLLVHLQHEYRVIPIAVLPAQRELYSPMPLPRLLELRLPDLRVLRVEPARGAEADATPAAPWRLPMGPLLWELALRGSREALLPEIAGIATYRVAPGADLEPLDLSGTLAAAVARLRRQTSPLREIAGWPGFDQERAMRMLNGLYLHAGLMISRTHPAAIGGAGQHA